MANRTDEPKRELILSKLKQRTVTRKRISRK